MYDAQNTANRIKTVAQSKNISLRTMLNDCELGINTVSKMANGTDILTKNLYKMAVYLDCSIDYLVGRTDNPHVR